MDIFVHFFICINWILQYDLVISKKVCIAVVPGGKLSYSTYSSKQNYSEPLNATKTIWCSADSTAPNSMSNKDYYPLLKVTFSKILKFVAIGLRGPDQGNEDTAYESFVVYRKIDQNTHEALKIGNPNSKQVKVFPAMSTAAIKNGDVVYHMFDYRVYTTEFAIHFKLKPGQYAVCTRIVLYTEQPTCRVFKKCKIRNGGCEDTCTMKQNVAFCSCSKGFKLWRDGFKCIQDFSVSFKLYKENFTFEKGQAQCLTQGGHLTTFFTSEECTIFFVTVKQNGDNNQFYYTGYVDVDLDNSFSKSIDGSHKAVIRKNEKQKAPGSTIIMGPKNGSVIWKAVTDRNQYHLSCRISRDDSYLFTGYHDVHDDQFSSSSFDIQISLASNLAFGPARSRRGSKMYSKNMRGIEYGSYWKTNSEINKFLRVSLNSENEITGLVVIGHNCRSTYVKFYLEYKEFNSKTVKNTKKLKTRRNLQNLIIMDPFFNATEITLKIHDDTSCKGYQWDLTGRLTGRGLVNECSKNPCSHNCIDTPENFFCTCHSQHHLFIDGKTCLPDVPPQISDCDIIKVSYNVHRNVLQPFIKTTQYFFTVPHETTFDEAYNECKRYGGYLFSPHAVTDVRAVNTLIHLYKNCTHWFLGLKGKSLIHTEWQDGRWVDFTLFYSTIPDATTVDQVAIIDGTKKYLWTYEPVSTAKACSVCQYREKDCDLPILSGFWTISRNDWTSSGNILQKTEIDYISLKLANGLHFFQTTEPEGFVQVDLHQIFLLHSVKCSSANGDTITAFIQSKTTSLPFNFQLKYSRDLTDFSNVKSEKNSEKFKCGSLPKSVKLTHFLSPVTARFVRIFWSYNAKTISFTLTMELYGCPAESSTENANNPQCGSKPSMYIPVNPFSYECFYYPCKVEVETCGFVNFYYNSKESLGCSDKNPCASHPCPEGDICLYNSTKAVCYCPQTITGNCDKQNNMWILVDKNNVTVDENFVFKAIIEKPSKQYVYYVNITKDYSCIPEFHEIKSSTKDQLCATISYKTNTGGKFKATVGYMTKGKEISSHPLEFTVAYHDQDTMKCLSSLHIGGASSKLQLAYPYSQGLVRTFQVSISGSCNNVLNTAGNFKIMQYEWTFSSFKFNNSDRCYSDADFDPLNISSKKNTKGQITVDLKIMSKGIKRVCLRINGTQMGKTYVKESCGFFNVFVKPLKIVLEHSTTFRSIPNNKELKINASASIDPNQHTHSNISFEWFCKIKSTNATCDFVKKLWSAFVPQKKYLLKETESILKIPPYYLSINETYIMSVFISKPNVPGANITINVFVDDSSTPQLKMRCIKNCRQVVLPKERLELEIECVDCSPGTHYLKTQIWKLSSKKFGVIPFEVWGPMTITLNMEKKMILREGALNMSTEYAFKVFGYAENGNVATCIYEFKTDSPPRGGSCFVSPTSGFALFSYFSVFCDGYLNDYLPLTYKIKIERKDKQDILLYYGKKSTVNFLTLSEGPVEFNFTHNLIIIITNRFETSVSVSLKVQVLHESNLNIFGLCLIVDNLMSSGDIISVRGKKGFLLLVMTVVDMAANMRNESNQVQKSKTEKMLLQLMDCLLEIDLNETGTSEQVTNIISDIVNQQDTFSPQMENKIITIVTNLVSSLVRLSQDGNAVDVKKLARLQFSLMDKIFELFFFDTKKGSVSSKKSRDTLESISNFLTKAYDNIGSSLLNGIPSDRDPPVIFRSTRTAMSVKCSKTNINELFLTVNVKSEHGLATSFAIPLAGESSMISKKNATGIDVMGHFWLINPYLFSESAKNVNMPVLSISPRKHGSSEELTINLTEAVDIFISIKSSNIVKYGIIYILNVSYNYEIKAVRHSQSLHISIPVTEDKVQILRIITIGMKTKLKISLGRKQVDNKTLRSRSVTEMPIPQHKLKIWKGHPQDPNLLFLTETSLGENGTNFIIDITVKEMSDDNIRSSICPVKIKIQTFNVDCSYWNLTEKEWKKDGCQVGKFTTSTILHCQCRHLSAFSGGIFVAPNVVHPVGDIALFLTFFNNPVVITVVAATWLLYFLLLAWARRADYNDHQKIGITVLGDSSSSAKYTYLICVVTGWWKHAGTSSRVFLYLCGKNKESAREALVDSERELFKSGAENWFLLRTTESLGRIKSVVIWHDNSGPKPSWYLKEVYVKDLQNDEAWHCVFDDWLSAYKGQGIVYAEIPAIEDKKYSKKHFYQFTLTTSHDIRDGHIWISIFYKPPTSSFTHIQRLTCAHCLLLCTMLANIMYYGIPTDDPEDQIDYGDFHLSLSEFVIGIQSALMVVPINLLIIKLFTLVEPESDEEISLDRFTPEQKIKDHEKKGKKKSFKLPTKSLYVIYFFTFLVSVICSYIVMLYGLKYGYHKSVAWIISFFTSFFESLFVLEPVKVLVLALLVTLIFKQTVKYDTGNVLRNIETDDEEEEMYASDTDKTFTTSDYYVPPMSKHMLQEIRKRIMLDIETFEILKEIIMYFVFVVIILLMVLGHRDITESYRTSRSIENLFINGLYGNNSIELHEVSNVEDMWNYLNTTLLINLMAGKYNSISNSVAFLVGRACLRQIRIKKKEYCKISPIIRNTLKPSFNCLTYFTLASSDTESYNRNWKYNGTNSHEKMWTYHTALDVGTLPIIGKMASYPGGGYIVELPRNTSTAQNVINDLVNSTWIDEYTRVVFVEFTVFNPNVDLFSVLIIMFEFSNTGFIFPYHHIYTKNFYHYKHEFEIFVAVCEGFFVLFLFSYTYIEIHKFKKQKAKLYFSDAWSYVEITILVLGYTVIGLFINRLIICNYVMNIFRKSNFDTFVSFHVAAVVDYILTYVTSALVTLTIIKFFKLLRFNARLSMLSETLHNARPRVIAYSFLFFAFTMSFSLFAVLTFGSILEGYRNIFSTVITLLVFILGQPNYLGLESAEAFWGPFFFFWFSIIYQYIVVNFFLIILMDAFRVSRMKIARIKTEIHIIKFLMKSINLLGFDRGK